MFKKFLVKLIKKTKTFKDKEKEVVFYKKHLMSSSVRCEDLVAQNSDLKTRVNELENELKTFRDMFETDTSLTDTSLLVFHIDDELKVKVHTKVKDSVIQTLINEKYIKATQIEDEGAINIAFVLIANEVTEQIIQDINEQASKYNL